MSSHIHVLGAKENNLKNIDVSIPKNKLTVITGISGSGKSSLAFDTIHAEGQRRYMESFSAYARQFIGDMERPDVDKVEGLTPVISIEQKTTNRNPRSTVGTITEIYDFFRLLYARTAEAYSYKTGKRMVQYSEEEIVREILQQFEGKKIALLAPVIRGRKGHYRELFMQLRKMGFVRARVDGEVKDLSNIKQLDRFKIHDIEIVIDRMTIDNNQRVRLTEGVQSALKHGKWTLYILDLTNNELKLFSKNLMCPDSGIAYDEPSPNTFSFNSPYGYCPVCRGLGKVVEVNMDDVLPDKKLSIKEGGIAPLGKDREAYFYKKVLDMAKEKKINPNKPIKDIPEKELNFILFGEDGKILSDETDENQHSSKYEGIVNMILRWYHSTSSLAIKRWAEQFMSTSVCTTCAGSRLKKEAVWFKLDDKNIAELAQWNLKRLYDWTLNLPEKMNKKQNTIAKDVLKEIDSRLRFLLEVGLDYLSMDRATSTLSGGESQRIRLATQIGSKLKGITYILDEPSIGLHQRDNARLIQSLKELRDIGNTVIVVEHDKDIMLEADYLIDIGPRAGRFGGELIGEGSPDKFIKNQGITAGFITNERRIEVPQIRRKGNGDVLCLQGAKGNNLKNVDVNFPLGKFICVTGVSGSGKSTLINETLYPILSKHVYNSKSTPLPYKSISGLEHIDKVIEIDQSPIGRSPRSNPATYCGFYTDIRALFANIPEAKIRGYKPGRFSFNVKGGRCEECSGGGMKTIEMNFLPDVLVHCEVCNGKRFNRETLEIKYKGKTIYDILEMSVDEAVEFFKPVHYLHRKIKTLADVGLGYITLGQSALTLSGGEAQRVKLSTELSKRDTGKTFYILDEPTTGLHFQDIQQLLNVLNKIVNRGNTVLVIEHNLDVIKVADHILDIGPEGGDAGGRIVATGTPEEIVKNKKSITGKFLNPELK